MKFFNIWWIKEIVRFVINVMLDFYHILLRRNIFPIQLSYLGLMKDDLEKIFNNIKNNLVLGEKYEKSF